MSEVELFISRIIIDDFETLGDVEIFHNLGTVPDLVILPINVNE